MSISIKKKNSFKSKKNILKSKKNILRGVARGRCSVKTHYHDNKSRQHIKPTPSSTPMKSVQPVQQSEVPRKLSRGSVVSAVTQSLGNLGTKASSATESVRTAFQTLKQSVKDGIVEGNEKYASVQAAKQAELKAKAVISVQEMRNKLAEAEEARFTKMAALTGIRREEYNTIFLIKINKNY